MTDYEKELREAWERWNAEIIPEEFAKTAFKATFKVIDTQPTIEAEQNSCEYWDSESHFCALRRPQAELVKHGRWLKTGQSFVYPEVFRNYFCSECWFELDKHIRTELPYCPNCGAKMDGGENDRK